MDTFKYIHEYIQVPGENLYLIVRRLSWNLVLFSFEAPHTSSRKPPPPGPLYRLFIPLATL